MAVHLDGFISDGGASGGGEGRGEFFVCGEVKVGEKDVLWVEHRNLGGLWFLDFDDELRLAKNGGRVWRDLCTCGEVLFVGVAGAFACAALDNDAVAVFYEFSNRARDDADTIFLGFDFLGDADVHCTYFKRESRNSNAGKCWLAPSFFHVGRLATLASMEFGGR